MGGIKYGNTERNYEGIAFKSLLEVSCYQKLKQAGFNPVYEKESFTLLQGEKLNSKVQYFTQRKTKVKGERRNITTYGEDTRKLRNITYVPDFYFTHKGYEIYFDTKGMENDVYPIKKKLFLTLLGKIANCTNKKYLFFEPHSVRQIKESITYILNL